MAMVLDAVVGAVVGELLSAVLEMKEKAVKFKPTLDRLESTLNSIQPLVNQIDNLNKQLDRPKEETEKLIKQMKRGTELVLKCSKVQWWKFCCRANFQEELEALDEEIVRFFNLDMQAQIARNGLETLVEVKEFRAEVRSIVQKNQRVELRGVYCTPPQPPAFTVGLDVLVKQFKFEFLRDQVTVSVLTVTGTEGLGKTTLTKMFCWDDQVRGKFKENIFFVTFAKTPKLTTIVQKLFQHKGYQVPEFQNDEDAVNQLENLLKRIGKEPILLVLDDVWPGSESLIDKFVFEIPNYLILVTSRVEIKRFGTTYELKGLNAEDALTLFKHSASLNHRTDIPDEIVKKIVKGCCGSPMALTVIGKSLAEKDAVIWHNRERKLSEGQSILNSSTELLDCLQKGFEDLEQNTIECCQDLSLFPEDQRIPVAALVDMWAELLGEDEATAMENIFELAYRNLADIFVTRKVASDTIDYSYHYVTQHDLLRELAFRRTSQDPIEKRNRLIIDISRNNLPQWWNIENEFHIAARILSISTDETFNSEWCNLQPTEVEVLVLNLREKKRTLPMFMEKMKKLKVLVITNYDFYRAELENFELLNYLSNLKRIRLEKVSIPFLSKTGVTLKNLKKFSFFMCNVNEAFKNSTTKVSTMLPNLVEMNLDYCDVVELPTDISDIVHLKKLSITNCHKFSALPEDIGKLVNLESLRLCSCTGLAELPDSITNLNKLKFLDISDCISLSKLPENIGKLVNLEKLNIRGHSGLSELPYSVTELRGLREVVCDEEVAALWEPFTSLLSDLKLKVTQEEINLNWLL